jgi:LysR family transcriptional activator of nhaA
MNVSLFERTGRELRLTDMGEKVFAYADDIFTTGQELESFIQKGSEHHQQHISVSVQATLSRNFTERFINPLLLKPDNTFSISTRGINDLLDGQHEFDIIVTNQHIGTLNKGPVYNSQLISRQSISIIGPASKAPSGDFPKGYSKIKWILPSQNIEIRSAFNAFCAVNNFKPAVVAQVDDMARLHLLTRDTETLAVLPSVVVKDEIENGVLSEYLVLPIVDENFMP